MYKPPIRLKISTERAIQLYNKATTANVKTDRELVDRLGSGRVSIGIVNTVYNFLNENELKYFTETGANFIKDRNYTCILKVQKEVFPGIYYIGEC